MTKKKEKPKKKLRFEQENMGNAKILEHYVGLITTRKDLEFKVVRESLETPGIDWSKALAERKDYIDEVKKEILKRMEAVT